MSGIDFGTALRQNWYLLVAIVVILAVAFGRAMTGSETAESPKPANPPATVTAPVEDPDSDTARQAQETIESQYFRDRVQDEEIARAKIEENLEKYREDPGAEDADLHLRRAGNLYYSKLNDWKKAAETYEELLLNYPDNAKNKEIYPMLAACYENMGDRSNALSVYRKMLDVFPPGSEYRQLAMKKLNE